MPRFHRLSLTLGRRDLAVISSSGVKPSSKLSQRDTGKKHKKSRSFSAAGVPSATPPASPLQRPRSRSLLLPSSSSPGSATAAAATAITVASLPSPKSCAPKQPAAATPPLPQQAKEASPTINSGIGSTGSSIFALASPWLGENTGNSPDKASKRMDEDQKKRPVLSVVVPPPPALEMEEVAGLCGFNEAEAQDSLHLSTVQREDEMPHEIMAHEMDVMMNLQGTAFFASGRHDRSCSLLSVESEPVPIPQPKMGGRTYVEENDGWTLPSKCIRPYPEGGCSPSPDNHSKHRAYPPTGQKTYEVPSPASLTPKTKGPTPFQLPGPSPSYDASVFRYALPQSPPVNGGTPRWVTSHPGVVAGGSNRASMRGRRSSRGGVIERLENDHDQKHEMVPSSATRRDPVWHASEPECDDYGAGVFDDDEDDDAADDDDEEDDDDDSAVTCPESASAGSTVDDMESSGGLIFKLEL